VTSSICEDATGEPSSQDKALAESLFREAKKLAKRRQFDDACPKFEESHRLDPQLGTLLYLATCHEQQGKTASAWAEFSAAAELAEKRGDPRQRVAKQRLHALEPGLSHLTIDRKPGAEPDRIVVQLDGKTLGAATLGAAVPVDPGTHEVTASADGYEPWQRTVEVGDEADRVTVKIGDLTVRPGEPGPAPPEPEVPGPAKSSSPLPVVGWTAFGVGAATLVASGALGIAAALQRDAANEECEGRFCTDEGLAMHDTSRDLATASTVTFIVGLTAAAAGLTLVLVAPSSDGEQARLRIGPTAGGAYVGIGGAW
jgi:hypothetical protein